MKKTAAVLAVCLTLVLLIFLVFRDRPGGEPRDSENLGRQRPTANGAGPERSEHLQQGPATETRTAGDAGPKTKEQFEQLSADEQQRVVEGFVGDFWKEEFGLPEETARAKSYLSLDVFSSPYMHTIKEAEFAQLSPADQEKAISEVIITCREYRAHILDVVAKAKASTAGNDYVRAEAYLISGLERGRGLTADKEGLLITRLVGIACQKACLKEMERLYTKTGDAPKLQMARGNLMDLDAETQEIRDSVQQSEK